ncbi:hypothetical protein SAMN04488564_101987 [Lentzea waywayandensis]|uniref:Uncharacterized protein n=1 Tax=Lentzea waywayandensis TaxID=84724 RepID=A0A1I6D3C8_9PSEU|nr:hypothetical protein [Lentzea waywayandensis]SFQ99998.1 hypothetical protein SAMN04488564_101987 [Lentzea waywayandensis]
MRIVGLLEAALLLLTGCGGISVETNGDLDSAVRTFIGERVDKTRPFTEFTSWDWDKLYVVDLDGADAGYVEEVTGEKVDAPWGSKSGVFLYYKDGKRVRAELMTEGAFCSGSYTREAIVDQRFACWLQDPKLQEFPVK